MKAGSYLEDMGIIALSVIGIIPYEDFDLLERKCGKWKSVQILCGP
jgi:hypothetical protein